MGIFERKKIYQDNTKRGLEEKRDFIERPKICLFDFSFAEHEQLKAEGYNLSSGSFGSQIVIPNLERDDSHLCLVNDDYPLNLHEYDIIIINQASKNPIEYNFKDHKHISIKGNEATYMVSAYPQTIFDPRPYSGCLLAGTFKDIQKRGGIIIVFGMATELVEYNSYQITYNRSNSTGRMNYHNYGFLYNIPHSENKTGVQFEIQNVRDSLMTALENHSEGLVYYTTFYHPTVRNQDYEEIPDPNFLPIIKNNNGDVISYLYDEYEKRHLVFPQIKNKCEFLKELLSSFLPDMYPESFPFSTRFKWVENIDYWLPNHDSFLKSEMMIAEEYKTKLIEAKNKIKKNLNRYSYLHDLLTQTGDNLVESVEKFLHFLEFQDVKNVDKENPSIKEEDLQAFLPDGILVIEVKGIGGMPKDIDCSQISKIKYRRGQERNSFDVKALTIINSQRYFPPLNRTNPPFTNDQISDAENDERGLISTWQLFNLFFDITHGLISKEDARMALLNFGLIKFNPSSTESIGTPKEVHYNGHVVVMELSKQELNKGDILFFNNNGRFTKATIISLKQDDLNVDKVDNGNVGIKLDIKIKKGTELWKKK